MHRSSDSINNLAAALAKAQIELVNPEKSLTATIQSDGPGGTEQTFNYASLASGLDIVRKTLGRHEIATVQTTAVDQAAGIISLTTVLAHSSGEWIASDWPVCAITETAAPQRMGKALTYARRYALFTLVGIAGEDDLDAPDLATPTDQKAATDRQTAPKTLHGNGRSQTRDAKAAPSGGAKSASSRLSLGPEASAELRDRLLVALNNLGSMDETAVWAQRSLAEKNQLTASDARCVEDAFQARLTALTDPSAIAAGPKAQRVVPSTARRPKRKGRPRSVDKSVLALPEPRRIRDREHVKFVAKHPCLVCGRTPADAHHLRFAQRPALGRKVSDEFTVPLCRGHHREVHRAGDEAAWWVSNGVDPAVIARALWLETHPLPNQKDIGETIGTSRPGNKGNRRKGQTAAVLADYETKPIAADARP